VSKQVIAEDVAVTQTDRPLRVGIAGCGHWATLAHVPAFLSCPDAQIVAICDIKVGRAKSLAAVSGAAGVYSSIDEMLANERLDLVSIVTPDHEHAAQARAAIAAGAHVLCEKPLALDVADARSLADLAGTGGLLTRVGFIFRYAPSVVSLRNLMLDGQIGEPHLLVAYQQNGQFLDPRTPFHWKMDPAFSRGGVIVEYGVHTLDLARWLMGEAVTVLALGQTLIHERPSPENAEICKVTVDDSTAWMIEFASGARGIGHAGWATPGRPPGLEIRIYGSRGAARVILSDEFDGSEALWLAGPDGSFEPHAVDHIPAELALPWYQRWMTALIRDFIAQIHGDPARIDPNFVDGASAQAVLDAALQSMQSRRLTSIT
jgi:predicted dehydrogenase